MVYVHASLNFGGGVGAVVKQLALQQVAHNNKIYILARESDKFVKNINDKNLFEVRYLKDKRGVIPTIVKGYNLKKEYTKIKALHPTEKIVLFCHCIGVVGLLGSIPKRTIIILHGHINTKGLTSDIFYKLLYRKYKCSNFVACSKECAEFYAQRFKIDCKVVLNGTVCSGEKKEYYTTKRDLVVGMISNLDNHKGFDYFLETAKILHKKYSCVKFFIVGENSEHRNIEQFANDNDLNDSIKYFGLIDNAADMLLPNIDLIVLPSIQEGLPMSLIEAQYYGIPILATKVGGIPELLIDGYNGYFIKRDACDIASKIELCLDKNRYAELSKSSFAVYNEKFSAVRMYEEYKRLVEILLGK